MKYVILVILFIFSLSSYAGGNTDLVKFPQGYKDTFILYETVNRNNGKQIAVLYANDIAINSVSADFDSGSVVVMEVFKAKMSDSGKPIIGENGIYEKGKFAAVAVMEKRENWSDAYPKEQLAGDWGFAFYSPDGDPKKNDLECHSCHLPLEKEDFLFSYFYLKGK